jgi:hypothetical protein
MILRPQIIAKRKVRVSMAKTLSNKSLGVAKLSFEQSVSFSILTFYSLMIEKMNRFRDASIPIRMNEFHISNLRRYNDALLSLADYLLYHSLP